MQYSRGEANWSTGAGEKYPARSTTCKPVATVIPTVEFPSHRINARIQYMRDHALIGKFIGIWPTERALSSWINTKWAPKGHISLHLGPKGFFTVVFNFLEDRNRILDGGPYFFNSAGLYLRAWVERFNPDKEDLSCTPVWIRLYSLPWEYWEETSLKEIGNKLGEFIKAAEDTKYCRFTSYARICVYMDLKQPLPDKVRFRHEDSEWIQMIDYEHVPFRCRRCHNLGHLFRDFPLNRNLNPNTNVGTQEKDGFTKVVNRRRGNKKTSANSKTDQAPKVKSPNPNSFEVLANLETQDPDQEMQKVQDLVRELPEGPPQQLQESHSKKMHSPHADPLAEASQAMETEAPESSSKLLKETEVSLP
eukprot:PITA_05142